MIADQPFSVRLQVAQALIAHGPRLLPSHLEDQMQAATVETREAHYLAGALLPLFAPDRQWHHRSGHSSDTATAYLLAGMLGCATYCSHLRKGGPQPAFIRLPNRRGDCARCVRTLYRPPAGEEDRCDLCGEHGIATFVPFLVRQGPALISGDVCGACASALGIAKGVPA